MEKIGLKAINVWVNQQKFWQFNDGMFSDMIKVILQNF